jgi:hypothetical protein
MEQHFLYKLYNRNKYILPKYVTETDNSKKNDDINDAEIYVQNIDAVIRLVQFLLLTIFIVFFYMWLQDNGITENYYPLQHKVLDDNGFHTKHEKIEEIHRYLKQVNPFYKDNFRHDFVMYN